MSTSFRQATLDIHNAFRKKHGAAPLEWHDDCAASASSAAKSCIDQGAIHHCHNSGTLGKHGQNIFMEISSEKDNKELTMRRAVKAWYSELDNYDFDSACFTADSGHFTQLIWKSTQYVGMVVEDNYCVANYFPAGNVRGKFGENVLPLVVVEGESGTSPQQGGNTSSSSSSNNNPYRDRLIAIYQKYAPEKMGDVDLALSKWKGKEEQLILALERKYRSLAANNNNNMKGGGVETIAAASDAATSKQPQAPLEQSGALGNATAVQQQSGPQPDKASRDRLISFYQKYAPEKVGDVDKALSVWAGKEEQMFKGLAAKYKVPIEATYLSSVSIGAVPQEAMSASAPSNESGSTSGGSSRDRLVAFYQKYAPEKVGDVDKALSVWAGKEEQMFKGLAAKYKVPIEATYMPSVSMGAVSQEAMSASVPSNESGSTSGGSSRDRLVAFYQKYAPEKVGDVDKALSVWAGKEEQMFKGLAEKYKVPIEATYMPSVSMGAVSQEAMSASVPSNESGSTSGGSSRDRLVAFYQKYAPEKVGDVDKALSVWAGKEEQMFKGLAAKYKVPIEATYMPSVSTCAVPQEATSTAVPSNAAPQSGSTAFVPVGSQPLSPGSPSYKSRLIQFYAERCPEKEMSEQQIDAALQTWKGKEEQMFRALDIKYPKSPEKDNAEDEEDDDDGEGKDMRTRLTQFYQKHCPEKVPTVDKVLSVWAGKEEQLMESLHKKYNVLYIPPKKNSGGTTNNKKKSKKSLRTKVLEFYEKYCPEKVDSIEKVLQVWAGREQELLASLHKKYNVPYSGESDDDDDRDDEIGAAIEEKKKEETGKEFLSRMESYPGVHKLKPSGVLFKYLRIGEGDKSPTVGDDCEVHYTGRFISGKKFDSSYDRGTKPAVFKPSQVIAAWKEALQLMRVGDKWEIFVPYEAAYGERGNPPRIPPCATLVFEMQLVNVKGEGKSATEAIQDLESRSGKSYQELIKAPPPPVNKTLLRNNQEIFGSGNSLKDAARGYISGSGTLKLWIKRCRELLNRDDGAGGAGSSDPYGLVLYNGREAFRTKVIGDTCDPNWARGEGETYLLIDGANLSLTIQIFDKDFMADDFLGEVRIDLSLWNITGEIELPLLARLEEDDEVIVENEGKLGTLTLHWSFQRGVGGDSAAIPQGARGHVSMIGESNLEHLSKKQRITAFVCRYLPGQFHKVNEMLERHRGKEFELLDVLCVRFGPEPDPDDYRTRLEKIYSFYEPSKLLEAKNLAEQTHDRQDFVFKSFAKKFGPEPGVYYTVPLPSIKAHNPVSCKHRRRLSRWFQIKFPHRLPEVDYFLVRFAGRENIMFRLMSEILGTEPLDPDVNEDSMRGRFLASPALDTYFRHRRPVNFTQWLWSSPLDDEEEILGGHLLEDDKKKPFSSSHRHRSYVTGFSAVPTQMRHRLRAFYQKYCPEKIVQVEEDLAQWKGKEELFFEALVHYFGPEPPNSIFFDQSQFVKERRRRNELDEDEVGGGGSSSAYQIQRAATPREVLQLLYPHAAINAGSQRVEMTLERFHRTEDEMYNVLAEKFHDYVPQSQQEDEQQESEGTDDQDEQQVVYDEDERAVVTSSVPSFLPQHPQTPPRAEGGGLFPSDPTVQLDEDEALYSGSRMAAESSPKPFSPNFEKMKQKAAGLGGKQREEVLVHPRQIQLFHGSRSTTHPEDVGDGGGYPSTSKPGGVVFRPTKLLVPPELMHPWD